MIAGRVSAFQAPWRASEQFAKHSRQLHVNGELGRSCASFFESMERDLFESMERELFESVEREPFRRASLSPLWRQGAVSPPSRVCNIEQLTRAFLHYVVPRRRSALT